MAGGAGACWYDALGHYLRNGEHEKMENLTARSKEGSTTSGKAPKGWVIDDGVWRERKGCGWG